MDNFSCSMKNLCVKVKAVLVYFLHFFSSPKLPNTKNKQYQKHVFGSIFRLEHNNMCSTFTKNIESSLIHSINKLICLQANIYIYIVTRFKMHSDEHVFKRCLC